MITNIKNAFRIHGAAWPFVFVSALLTFVLQSYLLGVLTVMILLFFRHPVRHAPALPWDEAIISAADGLIQDIQFNVKAPSEVNLKELCTKVSVFLRIYDVHVNRIPVQGKIIGKYYHPGQFINAGLNKASQVNERLSLHIQTASGKSVVCTQIAGLIARRIVCDVHENTMVQRGQYFGIIRFGSRVDIYMPASYVVCVTKGQKVYGGQSLIALPQNII